MTGRVVGFLLHIPAVNHKAHLGKTGTGSGVREREREGGEREREREGKVG